MPSATQQVPLQHRTLVVQQERLLYLSHILSTQPVNGCLMQGKPFDWHSTEHRSLDDQLLAVIDKVHRFGVCHHDLHSGNILITAEDEVVLLDFAAAKLNSSAEVCCEEREHMAMLLSLKAACHA